VLRHLAYALYARRLRFRLADQPRPRHELYFCEAYWPGFREIDFLRALRSYAARQSRPDPGWRCHLP
jgi:Putative undecaprenyl diphosphate synthase